METIGASLSAAKSTTSATHYSSQTFNSAVAASWFIRTIGIASMFCAVISGGMIGAALLIGVGVYILRSTEVSPHKPLGVMTIAGGILGALSPVLAILSRVVLFVAIIVYGVNILGVFSKEGINTSTWKEGRMRVRVGVAAAALSLILLVVTVLLTSYFLAAI